MTIKHIESLRQRIKDNLFAQPVAGYVCLGKGTRPPLRDYYNIEGENIYGYMNDSKPEILTPKWGGGRTQDYYYVTQQFYNENIAEKVMNPKDLYQQRAKAYFELMGIKVGSRVKITHKVESYANGWGAPWNDQYMDPLVGKEFSTSELWNGQACCEGYYFPFFAVIPVDKVIKVPPVIRISSDYVVEFKEDASIEVGCQKIPFATLTAIYEAAKSVNTQI